MMANGFVPPRVRNIIDVDTARMAARATLAPRVPWDTFLATEFSWEQGEHLAIIGPTGQGKTNLLTQLVPLHPYVVVLATKPRDDTMDGFLSRGFIRMDKWRSLDPRDTPRRIIWPDASRVDSREHQKEVFTEAFEKIFREGGWTVVIDELWYFINILKLEQYIRLYLLQARSLHISLALATQRPAFVPLEVYDQSTHLFFLRDNDERNLSRLSGISWRSSDLIKNTIADLERYQFLYVNTRTGEMYRSRSPEAQKRG